MYLKCISGVKLDEASHIVMSNNENSVVDILIIKDGVDEQMTFFYKANENDGEVITTLCACEDGANELTARIKKNFEQLNYPPPA